MIRLGDVRERMQHKSTDELLAIRVKNDREAWAPVAFEAIEQVLGERGVTLPRQQQPGQQHEAIVQIQPWHRFLPAVGAFVGTALPFAISPSEVLRRCLPLPTFWRHCCMRALGHF